MTNKQNPEYSQESARQRLNLETGRLRWAELQRHFARGAVLKIDAQLDLVEVAVCMQKNNLAEMEKWISSSQVVHANDDDAKHWHAVDAVFWAVVIAPWVLVQEII